MATDRLERITKFLVLLSTAGALYTQAWIARRAWPAVLPLTLVTFCLGAGAAYAADRSITVVLFLTYLVPLCVRLWLGHWNFSYWTPWLAAILGIVAVRTARPWAFPGWWKPTLMFWLLILALSWPIVALRELDFMPVLIDQFHVSSSRVGTPPRFAVLWIASVVSIAQLALLFLDWLLDRVRHEGLHSFERDIVVPLFASCSIASLVGTYQGLVDITFLNPTLFGGLGRAAGTMLDGNAYGMAAALWVPIALVAASEARGRLEWQVVVWPLALAIAIGMWASGSRTAFLAAALGVAVLAASAWRLFVPTKRSLASIGVTLAVLIVALVTMPARVSGPLRRIQSMQPEASAEGVRRIAADLWVRGGYGTAAVHMIKEHPFVGVGVGSYSLLLPDVSYLDGRVLPPDNAQNWYRHQLAELGVIGSLGWMAWAAMVCWIVVTARGAQVVVARVGALKGAIVGLSIASLLGMPTQDPAVALTFVVFVCWLMALSGSHANVQSPTSIGKQPIVLRLAISIGVIGFLTGTTYVAWTELRPPYRAVRAGWNYQYGFFGLEGPPGEQFRWTGRRAVDVFQIEHRWLKLEIVGGVPSDAAKNPLEVKVWRNHTLILRIRRRDASAVTRYIAAPDSAGRMMLEIDVNRTWQPSREDPASHDARDLGVAVRPWTFVDAPPPDALIVQ